MKDEQKATTIRKRIHVVMTLILFCVILGISFFKEGNVISAIFSAANYTYGPLMGLFFFGILTKRKLNDQWAWLVCVMVPAVLFIMKIYEQNLFGNYHFGFELLGINGILCFLGLWCLSQPNKISKIQE
jgi:hypothetical protein